MTFFLLILKRFTRDGLSFWLMTISFAVSIFAISNYALMYSKYKLEMKQIKEYNYYTNGMIYKTDNSNGMYDLTKEEFEYTIDCIMKMNVEEKRVFYSSNISDEASQSSVTVDFSDNYTNNVIKTYTSSRRRAGVYVGQDVQGIVTEPTGEKYIMIGSIRYPVNGVYRDFTVSNSDSRVVIPYINLNDHDKKIVLNDLYNEVSMNGVSFYIASDKSISEQCESLYDDLKKKYQLNVELFRLDEINDQTLFLFQKYSGIILICFSIINCLFVISLWMRRSTEEIRIRKSWGAGLKSIGWFLFVFIIKSIMVACPIYFALDILYKIFFDTFNSAYSSLAYYVAIILFGIMAVAMVGTIFALIKSNKIIPGREKM